MTDIDTAFMQQFLNESGNRTYSITARRMISGDVLKCLKGYVLAIQKNYAPLQKPSSCSDSVMSASYVPCRVMFFVATRDWFELL